MCHLCVCVCVCVCACVMCVCVLVCVHVLTRLGKKRHRASKERWKREGQANRYASERGSIEKERERAGERRVVARGPRHRDPPHIRERYEKRYERT